MKKLKKKALNFDELSLFARTDPSKFVETRELLISDFIAEVNPNNSLLELQNSIDAERYSVGLGIPSCYAHMASVQSGIERLKLLVEQLEKQILDSSR